MKKVQWASERVGLTRDEAIFYCFICTHDGHRDWRLPTRNELSNYSGVSQSSVLYSRYHADIDVRAPYNTATLIPVRNI